MKSKTKIILLIAAGVLVLALIVIGILYYLGYISASAVGGPVCPSTCSFDKAGTPNILKAKVYNTKTGQYQPKINVSFSTDDCDGSVTSDTPPYSAYCTTNENGECSAKVCVGERAAKYNKIWGVANFPAKRHFQTEVESFLIWGGTHTIDLEGRVDYW